MDLKGAVIRNFFELTGDINNKEEVARQVKIPHYQRPYSWGEEQISTLIKDWSQHSSNINENNDYFAGSIVTVTQENHSEHSLIDGQQRFTTIYLVNYVRFSILRLIVRQATRSMKYDVRTLIDKLNHSAEYLYSSGVNLFISEEKTLDILDSFEEQGNEDGFEFYCKSSSLPAYPEDEKCFSADYTAGLIELFKPVKLHLQYDRKSYSKILKDSLSKVIFTLSDQKAIAIELPELDKLTDVESRFLKAIETIFNTFNVVTTKEVEKVAGKKHSTLKSAIAITDKIKQFLDGVKLCVIQTGNTQDAYTLFEVLNDRSLSLSDLDLIKNQFYKTYCEKNKEESNDIIDKIIEARELQWGDKVFSDLSEGKKNIITYFTASFLTGCESLNYNSKHDSKDEITAYLKTNKSSYNEDDIKLDFDIFQTCKILIDIFDYVERSKDKKALSAEYSDNTITFKVFHLLSSLGQEGVLSGLVNLILKKIQINILLNNVSDNLSEVKEFINELKVDSDKNKDIHSQAEELWKLSLIEKDYNNPKKESNKLISRNYRSSLNVIDLCLSNSVGTKSIDEFKERYTVWQYGQNDLKIRILFARLFQLQDHDDKLTHTTFKLLPNNQNVKDLHLDHMEPKSNHTMTSSSLYFQNEDREYYVNGLGNMFPLPGDLNISKQDKPINDAWEYLTASGLGDHWLTKDSKKIFINNNDNNIPNENYFNERKTLLIEKFCEAIQLGN